MEHLSDHDIDIAYITETWLKSDKNEITSEIKGYGYELKHNVRNDPVKERGGGVGFAIRSTLVATQLPSKSFASFEHAISKLSCVNNKKIILISIYRLQDVPISLFYEEFTELLEIYSVLSESLIIAGDINIHVETEDPSSLKFHEIIDLFDLKQHVMEPTHIIGHTLDVVITRNKDHNVENIQITSYDLSHHFLIDFDLVIEAKQILRKSITYRNVKKVDNKLFCENIKTELSLLPKTMDMGEKVKNYTAVTLNIVNKHAPKQTKQITLNPHAPWFDAEYASLRRERRKAEKKFKRTGNLEDKAQYKLLTKQTTSLSQSKKKSYISDKLKSDKSCKNLYNIVNNLLDNHKEVTLPAYTSETQLANNFSNYFHEKVGKIRDSITSNNSTTSERATSPNVTPIFEFEPATADELKQIVMSYAVKCSPDDPVPALLLRENIDTFIPHWLEIVNLSLQTGSMECLKSAVIFPLIKDTGSLVNKENYKNYRPVSNLLFLSKLIERIVDIRIGKHMSNNNLHSEKQFGYKKDHSTESLLLKITNDLLLSCDDNMPSVVLLLDLSAAFDTVDHNKLLDILCQDIGIKGSALEWCKSFLVNRNFKVKIGDSYSEEVLLPYGVAQGSVLGPRFFNVYTKSLYKYVESTRFNIEGFADDHQLMKRFLPCMQCYALQDNIQYCLDKVYQWMNDHFLCLNPDKTKILVIAPSSIKKVIKIGGFITDANCIRFVDCAKNLGVLIDSDLSFNSQVNKVVKSCFCVIRKLSSIKHFLSTDHLKSLICSYVFSKIDYCNSLYYGLNQNSINKLQHVQNCAARLVKKKVGALSLDDLFMKFHWLKVRERIVFKLLLYVHKCLQLAAPISICRLLNYSDSERSMKLRETRVKSKFGDRAFSHSGPRIWNMLPWQIRSENRTSFFKKLLKSFLMINGNEFLLMINS